ncbi:MAG: ImmA/IrrE family metallo-endopeptidase [Mesorhizobium sp.]|nr:MAG: ImmA/IrrE family metallo-endopeptidase [Mesorhizobium sp.]TIM47339.1 MAG: ImmA/IrrE family metallo-endopeptidase [Mesorhizobium sp.]
MPLKLTPRPSAVESIRRARRLSIEAVAIEANIRPDFLTEMETTPTDVSKRVAFSLASALAVPVQFLFAKDVEIDANMPDFRAANNRPAVLTSAGLTRIARARSIAAYLADRAFEDCARFANTNSVTIHQQSTARKLLKSFYVPVQRVDGSVDPTLTFRETRVSLEQKGIIVLCDRVADPFRGFCYSPTGDFPIIFVNTTGQRPATKLFTLMHEVVHVLLGKTGVSDPAILNNQVERFCNSVTASVMMPAEEFSQAYKSVAGRGARAVVDLLSRRFGASKQASALRVSDLGLSKGFYAAWSATLPSEVPMIEEEDEGEENSGGGGISSQIARFGYLLPNMLTAAVDRKAISQFDAYRLTNLKPSTIKQIAAIGVNRLGP